MPPTKPRRLNKRRAREYGATVEVSPEFGGGEPAGAGGLSAASVAAHVVATETTLINPPAATLTGGKSAQPAKRARAEFDADAYADAMELVRAGQQML
jgi:hypothetical protein